MSGPEAPTELKPDGPPPSVSGVDLYSIADLHAYADFTQTVQPTLAFLQSRLGFDCWTVARKLDDEYVILAAHDRSYGLAGGEIFRWSDSLCARMALGLGPRVAPSLASVPAYARAPFVRDTPVGAYLGVPLHGPDGDLIGSLSAMHPTEMADWVRGEQTLVEQISRLVGANLAAHLAVTERSRLAERALLEASTDPLTGIGNRRAWEWVIEAEDERCARFGRPASVLSIDLDGLKLVNDRQGHSAGDDMIRRAATAISKAVRAHDVVARLGGDEFGVLAIECDAPAARRLAKRIARSLKSDEIQASIGLATRTDEQTLSAAWVEADLAMYTAKRHLRTTSH